MKIKVTKAEAELISAVLDDQASALLNRLATFQRDVDRMDSLSGRFGPEAVEADTAIIDSLAWGASNMSDLADKVRDQIDAHDEQ